jgi:hypothetical protein
MNDIDLLKTYQLCASGDAQWVVSVGPGATTGDLYAFNGRHNITTIGAFTATVSAAGGYILGGGIGSYSHKVIVALFLLIQILRSSWAIRGHGC